MRLRASFFWRLYFGYVALIVLLAGLVGILLGRQLSSTLEDAVDQSLHRNATMLAELARPYLVADPPGVGLQSVLSNLHEGSSDTRLTVIAPSGDVVADTHESPELMESHAGRPEVIAAQGSAVGRDRRSSATLGVEQMYLAIAVVSQGDLLGYARSSVSLSEVEAQTSRAQRSVALAATIAAIVALVGGYVFARRITGPIRNMTQAAQSVTEGDYTQRLFAPSTDEVGALASAFNRMTERLRTHIAEIEANHNKILAILFSMKEGVVAVDAAENVVHMNEAAATMVGVEVEACLDKPHWEVVRIKEICEALSQTIKSGQSLEGELRLTGVLRERVIELQTSVLLDSDGQRSGAVVVLHDASELRRLEGVRQDFVSNVSHEMKTPVAAVRGLVETILHDPEMEPQVRLRFLERANEQCHRLTSLVTDLLNLAAADEKLGAGPRSPLDLGPLLARSVRQHQPTVEANELTLEADLPTHPIEVMADDESLPLIVDNLITNAIRYTPNGGRVWIRLKEQGPVALIEIEDTGIGIEEAHQSRIFERFYRVDKARSRELGGTGLGLAIVKHLVLALGGRIYVESEAGRGSTFTVELPRHPSAESS